MSKEFDDIINFLDDNYPDKAKTLRAYVDEQAKTIPAL